LSRRKEVEVAWRKRKKKKERATSLPPRRAFSPR
jgi:hypothetical protein